MPPLMTTKTTTTERDLDSYIFSMLDTTDPSDRSSTSSDASIDQQIRDVLSPPRPPLPRNPPNSPILLASERDLNSYILSMLDTTDSSDLSSISSDPSIDNEIADILSSL